MDQESRVWVERASLGERAAVDELLALHLPGLRAYVRAHVGELVAGKESASDLVQSACREVLEHVDRFRYDGEDGFKRWLYATALRKIQDRHRYYKAEKRDAGRERTVGAGSSASPEQMLAAFFKSATSPSHLAEVQDEFAKIERALAELPENQRAALRLAYLEELPHREIAVRLGTSEANARMLLSRGLARLARIFE